MTRFERLRPTRATLAAALALAWAVSFGALRDFVWADLREGMINMRGLSRSTRLILWIGFALLFAMVGVLLFNDVWRELFALISMPSALAMGGRGRLVPVALVPATFLLFAVAWSFALTGLLHSHPLGRLGVLALYLLMSLQKIATLFPEVALGVKPLWELAVRAGLLLAVPLFYVLRWRRPARPAAEFLALLALVATPLAVAQVSDVNAWRSTGVPMLFSNLENDLLNLRLLIAPLLLLIGIDVANFARQVAGWSTDIVRARLPQWLPGLALLAILAWQLQGAVAHMVEQVNASSLAEAAAAYAGAAGELGVIGLIAWVVLRARPVLNPPLTREGDIPLSPPLPRGQDTPLYPPLPRGQNTPLYPPLPRGQNTPLSPPLPRGDTGGSASEQLAAAAGRAALPLIVLYLAMQLIAFVALMIANAFSYTDIARPLIDLSGWLNDTATTPWHLLVYGGALAVALSLALSSRTTSAIARATALYLGIFGALALWLQLTAPDGALQALTWRGAQPSHWWWTLLLGVVSLYWLARRRLTPERALSLLFALLIILLLQQTDFIESPFSPFFGFAGVGFIAFGIVWDVLTGADWVNHDSAALPRAGRVFLYVGYALLTVTVINWALASHDLGAVSTLTGGASDAGFDNFGKPLLYAVVVGMLTKGGK